MPTLPKRRFACFGYYLSLLQGFPFGGL